MHQKIIAELNHDETVRYWNNAIGFFGLLPQQKMVIPQTAKAYRRQRLSAPPSLEK
jgi:hypothetical protein